MWKWKTSFFHVKYRYLKLISGIWDRTNISSSNNDHQPLYFLSVNVPSSLNIRVLQVQPIKTKDRWGCHRNLTQKIHFSIQEIMECAHITVFAQQINGIPSIGYIKSTDLQLDIQKSTQAGPPLINWQPEPKDRTRSGARNTQPGRKAFSCSGRCCRWTMCRSLKAATTGEIYK